MLGGNLQPEGRNTCSHFLLQKLKISGNLLGHLAGMQILQLW